jgi:hypothetical protein
VRSVCLCRMSKMEGCRKMIKWACHGGAGVERSTSMYRRAEVFREDDARDNSGEDG